jgi:hypothetical protein
MNEVGAVLRRMARVMLDGGLLEISKSHQQKSCKAVPVWHGLVFVTA